MAFSKHHVALSRKSYVKPGRREFRPRLEALEDRLQLSSAGIPLDGIEAHSFRGFRPIDFVAQSTVATGVNAMLSLSTATYITGSSGVATARGIAVGNDGSTYETGTIQESGQEKGYVAKYDPSGKRVYLFTFQAIDSTAPDIPFANTEGHALAVDSVGNVYVAGTAINSSALFHNAYTVKIKADGTAIVWGNALGDGPPPFINDVSGDGIAVKDPNNDGNGLAVMTGTTTITDPNIGIVGDHVYVVRWRADGTDVVPGDNGAYYYYTFGTGASDQGTHGKALALNNSSTASTPGSLAYVAGNINNNGSQLALAFQITNGSAVQRGVWQAAMRGNASTDILTYTGVAVNSDDTSVFSGTAVSGSNSLGLVVGYAATVSGSQFVFASELANAVSLNAIAVDSAGNIYITGAAADPSRGGVYVAMLDNGGSLLSDLNFGGSGTIDAGYGIVVTSSGSLWVVGDTTSSSLSSDGTTLNGIQDGFLAMVTP